MAMAKLKLFLCETFVGRLSPYLLIAMLLGLFCTLESVRLIAQAGIGLWVLFSVVAYIRIPNDDDGGCVGVLCVYFFNFVMIEAALWGAYCLSFLCRFFTTS